MVSRAEIQSTAMFFKTSGVRGANPGGIVGDPLHLSGPKGFGFFPDLLNLN